MARTHSPAADTAFPDREAPARKGRNLVTSASLVGAAAAVGSAASDPDAHWYKELDKPSWQPPPQAFPIVWTTLYATTAATSAAVLNELDRRGATEEASAYRRALATNMALNGGWSWLFFRAHNLAASTIGAGVLAANTIALARRAGGVAPRFGRLLAPYAVWTSFATVLAGVVRRLNRDEHPSGCR
jgi:tryptophan-rich sensory protein